MDFHGFYTGQIFDAYEWMGAHYTEKETTFRTFAPQAKNVELLLAGKMIPMKKAYNGQFYEAVVENVPLGAEYEYRIYSGMGAVDHCDKWARRAAQRELPS